MTLSSSWGDVVPATVALVNGQAQAMVALNRETLPPQTATVTADVRRQQRNGRQDQRARRSRSRAMPTAIVPPPTGSATFGFADTVVAEPDVIITSVGQYRMYFGGYAMSQQYKGYNFGVATSTDGVHFTPSPDPIFRMPAMPAKAQINSRVRLRRRARAGTSPTRKACRA